MIVKIFQLYQIKVRDRAGQLGREGGLEGEDLQQAEFSLLEHFSAEGARRGDYQGFYGATTTFFITTESSESRLLF